MSLPDLDERECVDCNGTYRPTGRRQQRCPACREKHEEAERLLKKSSPIVKAPKPPAPTETIIVPAPVMETRPTLISLADRMLRDSGAERLLLCWNKIKIEIRRE